MTNDESVHSEANLLPSSRLILLLCQIIDDSGPKVVQRVGKT